MSIVGNEISWSTTPSDMIVRVGDALVHRVFQLVESSIHGEKTVLECGVVTFRSEATETQGPVDCMACMIQRTTTEVETEIEEVERFNTTITPW
jgi:hypothetical protein